MTVDQILGRASPRPSDRIARRQPARRQPRVPTRQRASSAALELLRTQGLVGARGIGDRPRVRRACPAAMSRPRTTATPSSTTSRCGRSPRSRSSAVDPPLERSGSAAFWEEVDRLHDLLDHEFFFPEGGSFRDAIRAELAADAGDWEVTLDAADGVDRVLEALGPFDAPRVLAPFLEAYRLVADGLRRRGAQATFDESRLASACLAHGELDLRLGRLQRPDAVSLHMFDTPLAAAKARGLLSGGTEGLRIRFADSVDEALRAVASLEARAGLAGPSDGRAVVSELP